MAVMKTLKSLYTYYEETGMPTQFHLREITVI
jgi:hypothetical protein